MLHAKNTQQQQQQQQWIDPCNVFYMLLDDQTQKSLSSKPFKKEQQQDVENKDDVVVEKHELQKTNHWALPKLVTEHPKNSLYVAL